MAKKVTAFFVLSVFALLLVVGMAWAKQYAPVTPLNYAREDYVTNYLLKPAGEYSFTGTIHSPYDAIVGYTYYDYQHNASIPRMIANDYQASGGARHFTWMELEAGEMTSNRFMDYNYRSPAGAWLGAQRISSPICRGGYTGLDIMKNSRAVICFHYSMLCGSDSRPRRSVLAIEPTTPGYNEFGGAFDLPDSATGFGSGGMWPHMAVDDSNRIHVLMQSGETAAGKSWWGYTRVTELSATQIKCQSPGVTPDVTVTKQAFTTSGANNRVAAVARTGTISEIVATSPVSSKVALIWQWPTPDTTNYQNANDIYYIESTNGGNDWLTSGFPVYPNIGTNITQFKKTDNYKAYCDVAAVYDYNDNLHIIWNAHRLNTETGEFKWDDVALMHWSAATTGQVCGTDTMRYNVISAGDWDAVAGAWNRNMAKMNAGVGVPGGPHPNWIYCNWTQFNPNDESDGGYTNGDIYVSVSTNAGLTWDAPRNVTNSPDPGCLADDCDSDHWSSMAARVDSFLYLQWVNDRDAGGIPQGEGTFTLDPILYYRYPVWTPVAAPRIDWTPKNFSTWISVPNLGSTTKKLRLSNIGTATLSITNITENVGWMSIGSYPASILEGACPADVNISINCGAYSETFLYDSIRVQSNDGAGNSDIYVRVAVIVSNVYKEPKFKAVGNDNFVLTESNLGNIGHQIFGMNLDTLETVADDIVNPIFDGSIILGQMASAPRVGRYVFDEQYMLALDTFKVVTKAGVGSKIIKKRYAPMNPMPPEWSNWWCWGVEEYDVIFSSGATTTEKERWLLLQYVKVFQYPPPTWWKPGFGCPTTVPDLYVGEAIDIDLPSDSGSQNTAGFDAALNLVYEQGYGAGKDNKFLGLALRNPNAAVQPAAYGGHVTRNDIYVYPQNGYDDDSLYNIMTTSGFSVYNDTTALQRTDYNVVLTAGKIASHTPNLDTTRYNFVVAFSNDGLQKLKDLVKMTKCGNANRDAAGAINLGDVIMVAQYVLAGGAQPWLYMADVDGNCAVNLGDCIYLAKYVLGPSLGDPKCNCEQKWP